MNLQLFLLSRIVVVALLCWLVIAATVLYQSHQQALQVTLQMAESLGKQLESQLLLINAGLGQANPFPDFELWKQSGSQPGVCVTYKSADAGLSRSFCNGAKFGVADWPQVFAQGYCWIFNPGWQADRLITLQNREYGSITVTPNADREIAEAWYKTRSLMKLSTVTVLAVCLLVYLSISRALRPAKTIVAGLVEIETVNPAYRLPTFELNEWRHIAAAINQLTGSQQQLLTERQKMVVKLINLQEDERRFMARELHDEFGQCLAAINAVASSIQYTAAQQCPELVDEAKQISRITEHMLSGVRHMLGRLRPVEFDELGLAASLDNLVSNWNTLGSGKTYYQLSIRGDCELLPESQAVTIFRIAQECLTNIAKHAAATRVSINMSINEQMVNLKIKDDGIAAQLPFTNSDGIGLLGIRERVTALKGQLRLSIAEPNGLCVEAWLPIGFNAEGKT